ncbi:unnamed protein product [Lymnaea stagnalis]|uniref:Uncharacterized protein n=1 Tax=Lymnaea stagnalis TaxID=6523 RepID=A0AAV2H108_LYMST
MTSGHASTWSAYRRGRTHSRKDLLAYCCLASILWPLRCTSAASGCADGSREAFHYFEKVAGCEGIWGGHIVNANTLCAPGWRVCTSFDVDILRNITWQQAQGVRGCMAINAAQDGGRCRECRGDLEHDDMAGVGQSCPYQAVGQRSCISGGRIDSSCCVDSHFFNACHFKPGLTTGVVCCRLPVKKPNIVVKPPLQYRVHTDLIILLTCQASGMPPPRVQWYKGGRRLNEGNSRINTLSSGELLISLARKSDTGLYTCKAVNEQGTDTASSYVQVKEYTSGCADGSTDGLELHNDIQACSGVWKGHVKFGKSLCSKSWRVCNPRDRKRLQKLNNHDVFDLPGCYAYNAASQNSRCKSCMTGKMSGIGKDCGWADHAHKSCLPHGSVGVFSPNMTSSCEHTPGLTTGVLCCRRPKRERDKKVTCTPRCENGGECVVHNKCVCQPGYKGVRCQIPVCESSCSGKGVCIKPNVCQCEPGYTGTTCRTKEVTCKTPCLNGGRCHLGKCKCPESFAGKACQFAINHFLTILNRTER